MVIDGAFLPQIAQINTDKTPSRYRQSAIIGVIFGKRYDI